MVAYFWYDMHITWSLCVERYKYEWAARFCSQQNKIYLVGSSKVGGAGDGKHKDFVY